MTEIASPYFKEKEPIFRMYVYCSWFWKTLELDEIALIMPLN